MGFVNDCLAIDINSPVREQLHRLSLEYTADEGTCWARVKLFVKGLFAEIEMLFTACAKISGNLLSAVVHFGLFEWQRAFSDLKHAAINSRDYFKTMVTLPFVLFANLFFEDALTVYNPPQRLIVSDLLSQLRTLRTVNFGTFSR